jgi:anti-sigma B factor antagonist
VSGDLAGPGMKITAADGAAVVTVPAEVDWRNADQLREAITSVVADQPVIVADMTDNRFCDSSGIAALVMAAKRVEARDGELRLALDGGAVRRIFKLTGVDQRFRIFGTVTDALSASRG